MTLFQALRWFCTRNNSLPSETLEEMSCFEDPIFIHCAAFSPLRATPSCLRYRAQLHRPGGARGEGPLSLDNVLEAFAWDLHKQGLLPSATSDTSSPNTAASASADARSGRHAGSSSASAAAVASALEPTPDKRLALAMAILDTYVKYPYPTKAWLPFNYCALPRLVPWTATLLTPLCGRG